MGMDRYLEALQARVCEMIAESKLEKDEGVFRTDLEERHG